jgi:hypothetical protein
MFELETRVYVMSSIALDQEEKQKLYADDDTLKSNSKLYGK